MATRLYFDGNYDSPSPSSWSAGWNKTASAATRPALTQKTIKDVTNSTTIAASGTSGHFTASWRFVSPPLAAQNISGTVKGQMRCAEAVASDNFTLAVAIKVVKDDLTDRGTLLAVSASDDTSATPPEMAVTTATNRRFRDSAESASISLSSLDVSAGDRIVVEIGFRQASTATSQPALHVDADSALSDLAEDDTTTTANNSWIEFSQDIQFGVSYFGSAANPADGAAATNTADPTAVTPPTGMLAGDLCVMIGHQRAASVTLSVSQAGGQTWNSLTAIGTTNVTARVFWCVFNGTWSADPSVDFSATTCNSVQMHVFRPATTSHGWAVNQTQVELDIAASPFAITGQTTTGTDPTVTIAGWFSADDNTWAVVSLAAGWQILGGEQYRNTSGSDQSSCYAFKLQGAAAATGNVTRNQATLGDDAATTFIVSFNTTPPPVPKSLAFPKQPPRFLRRAA